MFLWENWFELLTVAVMAKQSIFLIELTKSYEVNCVSAPIGEICEQEAGKEVIGFLFISDGQAARKTMLDMLPATQSSSVTCTCHETP